MDARRTIKPGYNQLGNMHLLEQPEDMMEIAIYFFVFEKIGSTSCIIMAKIS